MTGGLYLNLGCGNDPRPGMLNVDRAGSGAHVGMDVHDLALKDRCVAGIHAYHLVEHLGWVGCTYAFCEWFRVMEPGAELVVETPDLPESARQFSGADYERRALLANWIYGKESAGMSHVFGFEYEVLRSLLSSCGFVRIRREPPSTHLPLPGLRVIARRGTRASQEIHARFKRLLRERALVPDHQDLAVELHELVAADIVRTTTRRARDEKALHSLMTRLVVYDPEIARAALDAAASRLSTRFVDRWRIVLDDPETAHLPRALTGALLARPVQPGRMQLTFQRTRDGARKQLRERVEKRSTPPQSAPAKLSVRPFSVAGLCVAAEECTGRGLKAFVSGRLQEAEQHLQLAASLNSSLPVTFWNLSRIALARGDRDVAILQIDEAIVAARLNGSDLLTSLASEREAIASGVSVTPSPVSHVQT